VELAEDALAELVAAPARSMTERITTS